MRLPNVIGWSLDSENRVLKVEMEYLPELSDNSRTVLIKGKPVVKRQVREWMDQLSMAIKVAMFSMEWEIYAPVQVKISGVFKDHRHPDLQNFLKVCCDGVKEGIKIDDKHFLVETGEVSIGDPKLIIELSGHGD